MPRSLLRGSLLGASLKKGFAYNSSWQNDESFFAPVHRMGREIAIKGSQLSSIFYGKSQEVDIGQLG